MSKLFLLIGFLLSVLTLQIFVRSASAAAPNMALSPSTVQAAVGATFSLNVNLDPSTNSVSAVDLTVAYDTTKLQAQSLQAGSALPVVLSPSTISGGKANIVIGSNVGSPMTVPASVATVTFKVLQTGVTNVNIDAATQVAVIGQPGNVLSGRSGTVVNNAVSTPTPTSTPTSTPTPTPPPTSTPTPVPLVCNLSSASWVSAFNPVTAGTLVQLKVMGSGASACDGKQVAFVIFKDGVLGGAVSPSSAIANIIGNIATTSWTAQYIPDILNIFGNPTYHFEANLVGADNKITSSAPSLGVVQPTMSPVPSPSPVPTIKPTPPPTPAPGSGTTVTFNDISRLNQALNGQYPSGIINWGTNKWYASGPYSLFTTNSISFNGAGPTSATFSFVTPRILVSIGAVNGGTRLSNVTLACGSNAKVSTSLSVRSQKTIVTNWKKSCNSVTVISSNGWDVNFDNLIYR